MFQNCVEVHIHIILAFRKAIILAPILEKELYAYLKKIALEKQSPIHRINGTEDHIHILLKLHANLSPDILVNMLKNAATTWLSLQGYPDFAWEDGYGTFSCSLNHIQPLSEYISNQKEHHRYLTFAHEVRTLTKAWGTRWSF